LDGDVKERSSMSPQDMALKVILLLFEDVRKAAISRCLGQSSGTCIYEETPADVLRAELLSARVRRQRPRATERRARNQSRTSEDRETDLLLLQLGTCSMYIITYLSIIGEVIPTWIPITNKMMHEFASPASANMILKADRLMTSTHNSKHT
jgi:hypothetical protein